MKVNLVNMQRNTIQSYNRLIRLLNSAEKDGDSIVIDKTILDKVLTNLHNHLATVGSLMDENGKSYLDSADSFIDTLNLH